MLPGILSVCALTRGPHGHGNGKTDVAGAIEYAVWTKGEKHLQPWRHDFSWFQMMSLDVILTASVLLTLVLAALLALVAWLVRRVARSVLTGQSCSTTSKKSR